MRFLMVDRILSLEPGRRIETTKATSLSDEFLRGHFTRRPLVPAALLLETLAQSLGWLVIASHQFRLSCVLAGVDEVRLVPDLAPGGVLQVVGELASVTPRGSLGSARATVDGRVVASVERMLFGHVPHPDPESLRARFRLCGGSA